MARRWWLVTIVVAALAGGCADPLQAGSGDRAGADGGRVQSLDRQRQQAHDALVRYDQAARAAGDHPQFTPIGELTNQVGNWEESNYQNKEALSAGRVITYLTLPDERSVGRITWESGTMLEVPVLSAQQAMGLIISTSVNDCPQCTSLEITGATLTTTRIQTTHGLATVPAWEYTVKGTAVRLTRVAVDGSATVTVVPPPWDSNDPPVGLSVESARATVAGTQLTVGFVGSPDPASKPCGVDYSAEAVESDQAVVVIIVEHSYPGPYGPNYGCAAIGFERSATVDLMRPLGERAVLEVKQGLPVPVTITG